MIIRPGGKVGRFHTKSPVLVIAYSGGENFTKDDHVEKTLIRNRATHCPWTTVPKVGDEAITDISVPR